MFGPKLHRPLRSVPVRDARIAANPTEKTPRGLRYCSCFVVMGCRCGAGVVPVLVGKAGERDETRPARGEANEEAAAQEPMFVRLRQSDRQRMAALNETTQGVDGPGSTQASEGRLNHGSGSPPDHDTCHDEHARPLVEARSDARDLPLACPFVA